MLSVEDIAIIELMIKDAIGVYALVTDNYNRRHIDCHAKLDAEMIQIIAVLEKAAPRTSASVKKMRESEVSGQVDIDT